MKKVLFITLLCFLLVGCEYSAAPTPEPSASAEIEQKCVYPLPGTIEIEHLDNCTISVSFEENDIHVDESGNVSIDCTVYDYELFDMVDVSKMEVGDLIVLSGEEVQITELARKDDGSIIINGGLDHGGTELHTNDNTVYFESGYNNAKTWFSLGKVTLPLSPDFVFTDASDFDSEPKQYTADDLCSNAEIKYYFFPSNTSIQIENGVVKAMSRIYIP